MPTLLLNLRQVPEDEADEIRDLFQAHQIPCFETPPSRFGISAGAIWLADDSRAEQAQQLLADYQAQRAASARAAFADAQREGQVPGLLGLLRAQPLRVISALIVAAALVALCALPYFLLRD